MVAQNHQYVLSFSKVTLEQRTTVTVGRQDKKQNHCRTAEEYEM